MHQLVFILFLSHAKIHLLLHSYQLESQSYADPQPSLEVPGPQPSLAVPGPQPNLAVPDPQPSLLVPE